MGFEMPNVVTCRIKKNGTVARVFEVEGDPRRVNVLDYVMPEDSPFKQVLTLEVRVFDHSGNEQWIPVLKLRIPAQKLWGS